MATMHDLAVWSLNLGRWGGIRIRLHAFFLLFAVGAFYSFKPDGMGTCALTLAILFASVLLHELGHCLAAFRVGGHADQIVIGPLGGLAQTSVPRLPRAELQSALAGPAVNLLLALLTAPLLIILDVNVWALLNPVAPAESLVAPGDGLRNGQNALYLLALKLTFWMNWALLLVNLLPAFPFDGGRALRALLWPVLGNRTAVLVVARVAKVTALGICILAWLTYQGSDSEPIPPWVPLLILAIFLYFSANQETARLDQREKEADLFQYDFSQGYAGLPSVEEDDEEDEAHDRELGWWERWVENRRRLREQRRSEIERAEEALVDSILARLHETGLESLSAEDRALLNRVSARYRSLRADPGSGH